MQNIEIQSPRKRLVRDEQDEEEEEEEYLVANLTEHNKNMPSILIRIPCDLSKVLTKEEEVLKGTEEIKADVTSSTIVMKKIKSFRIDNTEEEEWDSSDLSSLADGSAGVFLNIPKELNDINQLEKEKEEEEEDEDELLDKFDSDNEDQMEQSILKTTRSKMIDIYEEKKHDENLEFLREHMKNELEYFLQKKNYSHATEVRINDIINIDYDKLNEKNIIPYFLTNLYDLEQKKKRERIRQEIEKKRKQKTEEKKERKAKMNAKNEAKIERRKSSGGIKGKTTTEHDDDEEEEEDFAETVENEKEEKEDLEENILFNETNVYNDPQLYGIEGSSDYSEGGGKSEEEQIQQEEEEEEEEEEEKQDGSPMAEGSKKKRKKKKRDQSNSALRNKELLNEEKNFEDLVDSRTEKLISYDYYSSLNINEAVKPNYKIKYLTSLIPIEENLDNYDDIQKLQYLIKHLPHTHVKEKRSLYFYNIKQFIKWKIHLLNNINICLYGIGSKFHLLNLFTNICLIDGHKCIMMGFEQDINFIEVLTKILEVHYKFKPPKNMKSYDLLYKLVQNVKESNIPLYFVIHNIDSNKLYPYYEYFSFLSKYQNIHFICSIDDVSFELNMNFKNINAINFLYIKCHTWIDYRYEILKNWNKFPPEWVYNKKSEEQNVQKNFETILNALNINHKRLFKIIASIQLENLEKGIFGVDKNALLQDKRIFTVGASSMRINSLLVEFVSHNVITETRLKEGNVFLKINLDKDELKQLMESL